MFPAGLDDLTWLGGSGGNHLGLTALRTMPYAATNEHHQRHGLAGQTLTQLVVPSWSAQGSKSCHSFEYSNLQEISEHLVRNPREPQLVLFRSIQCNRSQL